MNITIILNSRYKVELNNVFITTLLLMCSTHASAATPAEGDSTTAGNQSMRVVTFKAVPGTARTYYYHFEDDASKYDNNGYGQNIYAWFDILGHEVKHLDHIAESGNKLSYVVKFFGAYMKMGHDNVPEEKEADLCRNRFNDFYNHVSKIYGVDSFKKLFSEKADKEIIQTIDLWWNDFKNIK